MATTTPAEAALTDEARAYWRRFLDDVPAADRSRLAGAFSFGSAATEAELRALVLSGRKTATTSLAPAYAIEGSPFPAVGELAIVTTDAGRPVAVIETTEVRLVPFGSVDAAFAADEGEGDLSLAYWRHVHAEVFGGECRALGIAFDEATEVVAERFRLLHRADDGPVARSS